MALTNSCGGLRWDMLPDGTVAVDGQGVPVFDQGSLRYRQMEQTWANWGSLILDAASAHGVPPAWILAIATEETGLWSGNPDEQASKVSGAGARGVMQIMPATARGFGADPDQMYDPAANIDVGAALLAKLAKLRGGQLPEMAAAYNSGSVCAPGRNRWNLAMADDYAGNVIRWNNSAVMYLDMSPKPKWLAGLAVGAAGLYAAALVAGLVALPRWLKR
jgi:soluble lytic murein transglycosylase-like protein